MAGNDTTTTLNPGRGGDVMDETLSLQSDGVTSGKRPRVDLGFAGDGARGELVSEANPLPVESAEAVAMLAKIAADVRRIRELFEMMLG